MDKSGEKNHLLKPYLVLIRSSIKGIAVSCLVNAGAEWGRRNGKEREGLNTVAGIFGTNTEGFDLCSSSSNLWAIGDSFPGESKSRESYWYDAEKMDNEMQFKFYIHLVIFLTPVSSSPLHFSLSTGSSLWVGNSSEMLTSLFLCLFCLGPWGEWKLVKCDGCSGGRH